MEYENIDRIGTGATRVSTFTLEIRQACGLENSREESYIREMGDPEYMHEREPQDTDRIWYK
jgi:hypothetical protein